MTEQERLDFCLRWADAHEELRRAHLVSFEEAQNALDHVHSAKPHHYETLADWLAERERRWRLCHQALHRERQACRALLDHWNAQI